jgi:hypothetical protein
MAIFPQTSYGTDYDQALAGMKESSRRDDYVISRTAQEVTPFGVVATEVSGQPDQCRLPIANTAVILDDGGTWTAGNLVVVVNGVTLTVAFDTDKATSMAAVAAAIQALSFITSATYAGGSDTITVVAAANVALSITVDVSGITGTMTITSITYALTDSILGFSVRDTIEAGSFRSQVNDRAVATLSGDALAANDTVDGSLNGVAINTVTYATSEANTLQLVANELKAIAGVVDAVVDSTLRTITVTLNPGLPLDSLVLTVTDDAVASVSPTFAVVYSAQGVGIDKNAAQFVPTEVIPVLRKGSIWAQCEEDMTPASSVFVRIAPTTAEAQRGRLRTDIDGGTAVAATGVVVTGNSITDPNGQRIVPVELNLP